MSYFGKNIKKIRTAKKISQTAFADLFNIKRGSVGAYEEGRAEAKIDTIIEIATYYKLTIEQLICKELTFNEIYHIDAIKQKFEISNADNDSAISIPLITGRNFSDFVKNLNNANFINTLQTIKLPGLMAASLAFDWKLNHLYNDFLSFDKDDIVVAEKIEFSNLINYASGEIFIVVDNSGFYLTRLVINDDKFTFKLPNKPLLNEFKLVYRPYLIITNQLRTNAGIEKNLSNIESKLDKILISKGLI